MEISTSNSIPGFKSTKADMLRQIYSIHQMTEGLIAIPFGITFWIVSTGMNQGNSKKIAF